tara:strand:+ start:1597 stop:2565 length:969 start_codon:yes stop_codon:yes gene_type:complete
LSNLTTPIFSLTGKKIYVAGHNGMVGSAIIRRLKQIDCDCLTVNSSDLDLMKINDVDNWFKENKPDVVFMAAAKVGGIHANNSYPVDFLYENIAIQNSLILNSHKYKVKKLMFLGSSCIYPVSAKQPLMESSLLTGSLEKTNESYAIAKITGIKLCQAYRKQYGADFISVMPTNLYGPGDNFHPENSHVVAALISKFHNAVLSNKKTITLWGTGKPKREFLDVDDLADGLFFIMENYSDNHPINIGTGKEISIIEFANLIKNISGWNGDIIFDSSYPDGMPRKVMDVTNLKNLGWTAPTKLESGIKKAYDWYVNNLSTVRKK